MKIILVRYGELTLKGKNRSEFERVLYNNIKKQLKIKRPILNTE